jgi:hypothetical protein
MGGAFLGNPTADARADVQALNEMFAAEQAGVDVDAVVAFLNPRVKLDVAEPDFPVTNAEGLQPYIASLPSDPTLHTSDLQRLVELIVRDGEFQKPEVSPTRRPVKRRAA